MADRKDSFSLDGLFGGNFWEGVNKNVKQNVIDAVVGMLSKAGALTEAQAGLLNAQRDRAVIDTENGRLRQASVRPGQYLSQRQREEILNPESKAERLARLQFHGGVANGRWITSYDEWKAAGDKQHTKANGERIEVKSFGPRRDPLTAKDIIEMARRDTGGDRRVHRDTDGNVIYTFGGYGNRAGVRREALHRLSLYDGKTDEQREKEWLYASPEPSALPPMRSPDWISRPVEAVRQSIKNWFSASKGGETMRERGWLDAVFARAERAAMRGGRTRR